MNMQLNTQDIESTCQAKFNNGKVCGAKAKVLVPAAISGLNAYVEDKLPEQYKGDVWQYKMLPVCARHFNILINGKSVMITNVPLRDSKEKTVQQELEYPASELESENYVEVFGIVNAIAWAKDHNFHGKLPLIPGTKTYRFPIINLGEALEEKFTPIPKEDQMPVITNNIIDHLVINEPVKFFIKLSGYIKCVKCSTKDTTIYHNSVDAIRQCMGKPAPAKTQLTNESVDKSGQVWVNTWYGDRNDAIAAAKQHNGVMRAAGNNHGYWVGYKKEAGK